jgi:16S rRNA (guanine527-N7)-methyltransferase
MSGENVPRETSAIDELRAALQELLPPVLHRLITPFEQHYALLIEWNKTHNLTRITEPAEAASRHYLDGLLPLLMKIPPERAVDIGSGTGLPGLVAAALWPECKVFLVEKSAKKVSFLKTVRARVSGLDLEPILGRSEEIEPLQADLVVTRATFQWNAVVEHSHRHLAPGGYLLAYLGAYAPGGMEWSECAQRADLVSPELSRYLLPPDQAVRHLAQAQRPI